MSFSWVRGMRGGRLQGGGDGAGRSAHSSLGCNWISAARAGRMFSSHSPCRGELARSGFPTSPILSRLARLMDYFLHRCLRSPSVICMSDHVGEQVHAPLCDGAEMEYSRADTLQNSRRPCLGRTAAETQSGGDSTRDLQCPSEGCKHQDVVKDDHLKPDEKKCKVD